ncbi:hypothetical protein [Rhodococcus marinonascens]|uniref:hypothetical protein n=1 Tax=Rhodococcus marinonascens TaxID=38311 RepID=UPI0009355A20|nr:hypothetical protein [Rhodococcus marinonascens]
MQFHKTAGAGVLALALAVGFANNASAEEIAPDQAVSAADAAVAAQGAPPSSAPQGLTVDLPSAGKPVAAARAADGSTVTLESSTPSTGVSPVGGKSVKTLSVPSSSVVTESVSDGFRKLVVIGSANSPTHFDFDLGLPQEIVARPVSDGSILLQQPGDNGLAATVGKIEVPWAKDAKGADVSTRLEMNGEVLTQVVDHHGAAYPVTADPMLDFGSGVDLNLTGEQIREFEFGAGAAISALALAGCGLATLPTGVAGAVVKVACAASATPNAIDYLTSLMDGSAAEEYDADTCYQTSILPPTGEVVPVAASNCE